MQFPLLLILVLLASGCTGEPSTGGVAVSALTGNHLPVIHEATIIPTPLTLDAPISVRISADDSDRDPVAFSYQWIVNGRSLEGKIGAQLPQQFLKQGDKVSAEIVPDDGKAKGVVYRTPVVTVANTPPILSSLSVNPQPGTPGDKLEVRAEVTDLDADLIDLSFRWWRNGSVVKEGEDSTLDTSGFLPKDLVVVEVIPRDQKAAGKSMKSGSLFASNSPPTITSTPSLPTAGTPFEYLVRAVDPEGDQLKYRLETAPAGMMIDAETGHIHWPVVQATAGTHHVRVVVEDAGGGRAFQEFDLSIPPSPAANASGA